MSNQHFLEVRRLDVPVEDVLQYMEEKGLIGYIFDGDYYTKMDGTVEFYSSVRAKWYDCEEDMKEMSKAFPSAVFRLSIQGDSYGPLDFEQTYYYNGISEYVHAIVPDPKSIKW